jgi:hypothetical protein
LLVIVFCVLCFVSSPISALLFVFRKFIFCSRHQGVHLGVFDIHYLFAVFGYFPE